MPTTHRMLTVFAAAELLLALMFHALIALALLALLLGGKRAQDRIYRGLQKLVWLPLTLADGLLPRGERPTLLRLGSAIAAFVAWFALLPKLSMTLAKAQLAGLSLPATLALLAVLFGLGQWLPLAWLRPWVRGLLALALVEFAHLALFALFRAQGWLPVPAA